MRPHSFLSLAIVWLLLMGCANTPTPNEAYPPPPLPPENPNLRLTPTSILEMVVSEVQSVDDHVELTIYPTDYHPYTRVEVYSDAYIVQASTGDSPESRAAVEDIVADTRVGIVGYEKVAGESGTPFVAREIVIMEYNATYPTPTPGPQWGEPGYPAPTIDPVAVEEGGISSVPLPLPATTPCPTCEPVHLIGTITEEVPTGDPAGNRLFRVLSVTDGGVWYVVVAPTTEITFEDWSAASGEELALERLVDVVGPLWSNGYVGAEFVIVLDPEMNSFPTPDPNNPLPSWYP